MSTNTSHIFVRIGGRRFFVTVICQIMGFVAVLKGVMTGGEYVAFTTIVAGVYVGGNTTQKVQEIIHNTEADPNE